MVSTVMICGVGTRKYHMTCLNILFQLCKSYMFSQRKEMSSTNVLSKGLGYFLLSFQVKDRLLWLEAEFVKIKMAVFSALTYYTAIECL